MLYVATANTSRGDPDLNYRVRAHLERRCEEWGTLEIAGRSLDVVAESTPDWDSILFDSITLWVSERMFLTDDAAVLTEVEEFLETASDARARFVFVSDEVGLGVVPETKEGRRFRDLLGLVNQRIAQAADEVYLCVSGVEMRIK